ncbi:hypothetical protein PAXRUDRAFT_830598 [Paxillus rubicundulus Ve08.2h10]|uniref:Uncharacterized protein n=1 Tax=Paxillus rubicundulus Ve08.2h10 TaxID=930991 RepID=A0A0D0DYI4_9AGAM|nr:hypothetical protein PAXRUDRAFT_830598 [Paxillus rubicundulus Ve08.2h10]
MICQNYRREIVPEARGQSTDDDESMPVILNAQIITTNIESPIRHFGLPQHILNSPPQAELKPSSAVCWECLGFGNAVVNMTMVILAVGQYCKVA